MDLSFLKNVKLKEAILFFSGGKDSIASLDLIRDRIENITAIYLYFIPGLEYKKELFQYYENRYGIKILEFPHPFYYTYQINNVYGMENQTNGKFKKKDLTVGNFYRKYKNEFKIEYSIIGDKRADNITRARILFKHGAVDVVNKIIYPVAYFSNKEVYRYIEEKKLILHKCYHSGFKGDITTPFSKDTLLFFKENYINDFYKILEIFPQIESILHR